MLQLLFTEALSLNVLEITFITASSLKFLIASELIPKIFAIFSHVDSSTSALCSILEIVCWLTPSSKAR
jgi:hypothetical protein